MDEPHGGPGGGPVDPRFTLASERTFLAWSRTSLGLVAAGLASPSWWRSRARG